MVSINRNYYGTTQPVHLILCPQFIFIPQIQSIIWYGSVIIYTNCGITPRRRLLSTMVGDSNGQSSLDEQHAGYPVQ